MRNRCCNPNAEQWKYYGERGIRRCEEWETFEGFLADMGERPDGATLERIDPLGNYEPSNCKWASVEEQNNNKTNTPFLNAFGETKSLMNWSRELGVSENMIRKRLNRGWTDERALTISSRTPWQHQ